MSEVTIPRPVSRHRSGPLLPALGGAGLTDDPHLRALAEDIAGSIRCSFIMAAAGTTITRPGAIDTTIADFLATRSDSGASDLPGECDDSPGEPGGQPAVGARALRRTQPG